MSGVRKRSRGRKRNDRGNWRSVVVMGGVLEESWRAGEVRKWRELMGNTNV